MSKLWPKIAPTGSVMSRPCAPPVSPLAGFGAAEVPGREHEQLAGGEGDNDEVIAAHTQGRVAQQQRRHHRQQGGQGQDGPESEPGLDEQNRGGIPPTPIKAEWAMER